uniref:YadA-like family protein n=1 Tax=Castellaniella defragrans TaxID=75697 RepID=UPI003342C1B8
KIALNDDLELSSVTTGKTIMDNDGVRINDAVGGSPAVVLNSTGLAVGSNVLLNSSGLKVHDVVIDDQGINAGGNQITGVAAGMADSDAVNVAQLKEASNTSTALGMNFADGSGSVVHRNLGETLKIEGKNANITTEADGSDTLKIALNDDLELSSVTTGKTLMNDSGISVKGAVGQPDVTLSNTGLAIGPNVGLGVDGLTIHSVRINDQGINAGGQKITHVKAGSDDEDAVNFGQLKDILNGTGTTPDDLVVRYDDIARNVITLKGAGGTTITNVARAQISASSMEAVNGSQIHEMGNSIAKSMGGDSTFTTDGKLDTKLNVGGNIYDNVNDALDYVLNNAGGTGSGNWNIQANGDASSTVSSGDTVQFISGDDNIQIARNGNDLTIGMADDINVNSVTANTIVTQEIAIDGGPVISQDGIDMQDKKITNVADGTGQKDAVNVGQLNNAVGNVTQRLNQLDSKIASVDNRASAGVAAALATAGLPQAYMPGKSMISLAGGAWRGETGYAMGLSTVSNNGKWVLKASASGSARGDYGGAVGVGYQW